MQANRIGAKANREPRVTIMDVAERSGVTKSTVSRALNDYADISDRTRQRVRKAANDLGYQPMAFAQGIRTGRTRSLGLVLQVNEHDAHRPFLTDFLAGVTQAASAENWTLTVATAEDTRSTLSTMSRLLDERKADGFILPRTLIDDPRVEYLRRTDTPFILFGRTQNPSDCAWFDVLGETAISDAVIRLAAQGHERIGFINGGDAYYYSVLRRKGYEDGLFQSGLSFCPELIGTPAVNSDEGQRAARELLAQPHPPTAFIYAVDAAALGLYRAAQQLGLTIGTDISVMAYDGIPEGALANPPLSTFSVDSRHAGKRLARMLIQRIRGAAPEELRETELARLVARASDGPPRLTPTALAAKISRAHKNE